MIDLCYLNDVVCVYNLKDWEVLRKEHRILGYFLGSSQSCPALPLALLPEEVTFLVTRGIAKVIQYPELTHCASAKHKEELILLNQNLLHEQRKVYRDLRKRDLNNIIEKIIAGKRKKGNEVNGRTREEVLEEELDKSCNVTEETMIWPVLTEQLATLKGNGIEIPLSQIFRFTNNIKCTVFLDLWEKGYFISPGFKFGGDFLVYLGDPIAFHAVYIIRCVEDPDKEQHTSEIVAFGRLGTSVKKKAVLASLNNDNTVSYITLSWLES